MLEEELLLCAPPTGKQLVLCAMLCDEDTLTAKVTGKI